MEFLPEILVVNQQINIEDNENASLLKLPLSQKYRLCYVCPVP